MTLAKCSLRDILRFSSYVFFSLADPCSLVGSTRETSFFFGWADRAGLQGV